MKKAESFIENRIRWRAGQYGLPKQNTDFWENINIKPQIILPHIVGKPVLVSVGESGFVVVCTQGVVVTNRGIESSFTYDVVEQIRDLKKPNEKKEALSTLVVLLTNGKQIQLSVEPGGAAFGIWNILIMLMRMS